MRKGAHTTRRGQSIRYTRQILTENALTFMIAARRQVFLHAEQIIQQYPGLVRWLISCKLHRKCLNKLLMPVYTVCDGVDAFPALILLTLEEEA